MSEKREVGLQFERVVFFSDAVFAIAITLLVLDLRLPESAHGVFDLAAMGDKLFGFFLSFAVIGIYWLRHHHLFGALVAEDKWTRLVNLVFLATVVFLPFPTSVIASHASPSAIILYALSVSATGLMFAALALTSRRPSLMQPGETAGGTALTTCMSVSPTLVFLATALVAPHSTGWAMRLWWLAYPAVMAGGWVGEKLKARIDHA